MGARIVPSIIDHHVLPAVLQEMFFQVDGIGAEFGLGDTIAKRVVAVPAHRRRLGPDPVGRGRRRLGVRRRSSYHPVLRFEIGLWRSRRRGLRDGGHDQNDSDAQREERFCDLRHRHLSRVFAIRKTDSALSDLYGHIRILGQLSQELGAGSLKTSGGFAVRRGRIVGATGSAAWAPLALPVRRGFLDVPTSCRCEISPPTLLCSTRR